MPTPTIYRARSARTYTWLLTSLLTVVGVGLAGCGGGGDEDGAGTLSVEKVSIGSGLSRWSFKVGDLQRQMVVAAPSAASSTPSPLVFVFHGHGGTDEGAAARFEVHKAWPEAVVAYMQGLPGVAGVADEDATEPSWQKSLGELEDRDIRYVEAALALLKRDFRLDAKRLYALGHSNGARFTNVLWASELGTQFAAFCSAAAQGGTLLREVEPRSLFMILGKSDKVSPYEGQTLSIPLAQALLSTDPSGARNRGLVHSEPGKDGLELVTYIHPGGHEFPLEAMPEVVAFFQRHSLPT